jgi:uncharacterized membrane protein YfcA
MPVLEWYEFILIGLGALAAGAVNALAGGGTLITFPLLTAVGIPAVAANVTNTVALCPGYLGGTMAQAKDLKDQKRRLWILIPVSALGGVVGGILLLFTGEKLFRELVPWLILMASVLLAVADPVRNWLQRRAAKNGGAKDMTVGAILLVGLAAVYGGYFGAGLSVIVLAVLGLTFNDSLTRLNALKQAIAFSVNTTAAIFFTVAAIFFEFSAEVVWPVALVMAVFALIGGNMGGRLAGRIKPSTLRKLVVAIGFTVSIIYFVK